MIIIRWFRLVQINSRDVKCVCDEVCCLPTAYNFSEKSGNLGAVGCWEGGD